MAYIYPDSTSKARSFCTYIGPTTCCHNTPKALQTVHISSLPNSIRFFFLVLYPLLFYFFPLHDSPPPPPLPRFTYDPFRSPSINRFTSAVPTPTTFSISSPALRRTSSRTFLLSSRCRSFFLWAKRAAPIPDAAISLCLTATSMRAERDSRVGGGSAMCSSSGFVGDVVGAREWGELFRAERTGLRCCGAGKRRKGEDEG